MKAERKIERRKILIIQSMAVVIIDVLLAVIVSLIAGVVCRNGLDYSAYMRILFIPLLSFASGFASLVFTRNLWLSMIANFVLCAVMYMITNGLHVVMLLWILLYCINAVPGYVIALAARSYRAE